MHKSLPPPVVSYLEQLERSLKLKCGVVPEDALDDARAHLERHCRSLREENPEIDPEEMLDCLIENFGSPAEVAEQYESEAEPLLRERAGYAPGWRICCTRCGRSAPATSVGAVRIAARSLHKYTLGWCQGCRGLRLLRFQRDLVEANLTQLLGVDKTPEQVRRSMHFSSKGLFVIIAIALLFALVQLFFATSTQ